jgi:hypothetical protein
VPEEKKKELNKLIAYFKGYGNTSRPLVISFMLAITNHWMSLIAVKQGSKTQYWFFDSSNRHYLHLSPEEIDQLVENINAERIQMKR